MGSWGWVPLNKDKNKQPWKSVREQLASFNNLQPSRYLNQDSFSNNRYSPSSECNKDGTKHQHSSNNFDGCIIKEDDEEDEKDTQNDRINVSKGLAIKELQDATIDNKNNKNKQKEKYQEIRWERGELIGSGTYGKVYQGLNLNNGNLIAIKSVHIGSNKTATKELMALKYEVSILRELDHPNIVKYIYTDADPVKKRVDILLEYVPGGSLSSLLKKFGPFNEKITKIYLRQMLDALVYIHSKGIVHRDLKCANVLINNDASIRLSDFGASK